MNTKLLLDLFLIPSQSGSEGRVQEFISTWLREHGIEFEIDEVGNIYNISKVERPLLSAHMDTVQDDFDELMAKFIEIKGGIVKGYGVIGGDDKCGIYAILDLLENGHDDFNFVFSVQEEIGGVGIEFFTQNQDLSHITWGLVLDRKGKGDILCDASHEYGTKQFEDALLAVGKNFGFEIGHGTFSDADYLSDQISCANISVGYYNAHTKHEYVVISELQNTINYVHNLVKHLDVRFAPPDKKFTYSSWNRSLAAGSYDESYDFDDIYGDGYGGYTYSSYNKGTSVECCDICGSVTDDTKMVKALGFRLCRDCKIELFNELQNDFFYEQLEDEYKAEGY